MKAVLVGDSHSHSNPVKGLGASEIASRFRREGGWFMAILSLNPWSYGIEPPNLEAYERVVKLVVSECRRARDAGLKVACFSGFHPADVERLIDRYRIKPEEVLRLGVKVVSMAARLCREGVLDGIGEVGRQHFKTSPERVAIAMEIAAEALLAAEEGCLVQLHLEQGGRITVETVHRMVDRAGLSTSSRARIIFHHSTVAMAEAARSLGYWSTVPGVPKLLDYAAFNVKPVFLVESDFIDDPRRPGVVVYPWVMAAKLRDLASQGAEDWVYKVSVDNVVRVFGVEPP